MPYAIKEIYYTLQGEGHHVGTPAVLLRFSGCNLWNGLEAGRAEALCKFCDTDFYGMNGSAGGHYANAQALAVRVEQVWAALGPGGKFVVCTGGEPLLQLDQDLIDALHAHDFTVAIETNGTIEVPQGIDWITVSPKASARLIVKQGDELKLVYPQQGVRLDDYLKLDFKHYFLQPMDGADLIDNTSRAVQYCLANPRWRLTVQTHKMIGID